MKDAILGVLVGFVLLLALFLAAIKFYILENSSIKSFLDREVVIEVHDEAVVKELKELNANFNEFIKLLQPETGKGQVPTPKVEIGTPVTPVVDESI